MVLTAAVCALTLYFALFLGVSGLAKIDSPLLSQGERATPKVMPVELLFAPLASRVLGVFEIALASFLATGISIDVLAILNAALFGVFLLFKFLLMLAGQGRRCGCFGAHGLREVDTSSVIASTLVLGLAVVLAVLAQRPSANALNWIAGTVFVLAFGWILVSVLRRRRLLKVRIRRGAANTVIG